MLWRCRCREAKKLSRAQLWILLAVCAESRSTCFLFSYKIIPGIYYYYYYPDRVRVHNTQYVVKYLVGGPAKDMVGSGCNELNHQPQARTSACHRNRLYCIRSHGHCGRFF